MRIRNTIHPEACPFLGKRSCQVLRTGILVQYQLRCQIVDSWNAYKLDNCWPPGPNIIITSFSPESKLNLAWNINNGCLACGHRHLIHFSPISNSNPNLSSRQRWFACSSIEYGYLVSPNLNLYFYFWTAVLFFGYQVCLGGEFYSLSFRRNFN